MESRRLAAYRAPGLKRSLFELVVTAIPFLIFWVGTLIGVKLGYWPSLLLALPAAAFLVRLFMIQHDCGHGSFFRRRLPNDLFRADRRAWTSTLSTNLAIAALLVGLGLLVGFGPLLLAHVPIILIASAIGIWLFYVQHQFEHTYWARDPEWSFHKGAIHGNTHYDLPALLPWLTANIGIHHAHHLVSRIPSYRLNEVLRHHPELRDIGRLTLAQSLRCFRLALWDEQRQRLVGFREAVGACQEVNG